MLGEGRGVGMKWGYVSFHFFEFQGAVRCNSGFWHLSIIIILWLCITLNGNAFAERRTNSKDFSLRSTKIW